MILTALPDPLVLSFGYNTCYNPLNHHYSLIELILLYLIMEQFAKVGGGRREAFSRASAS